MRKVQMVGASAGSLLSVLAACGVPADRVIERAYQLSVEHNIWERPLGLVGIWGSLIEQVRLCWGAGGGTGREQGSRDWRRRGASAGARRWRRAGLAGPAGCT